MSLKPVKTLEFQKWTNRSQSQGEQPPSLGPVPLPDLTRHYTQDVLIFYQ